MLECWFWLDWYLGGSLEVKVMKRGEIDYVKVCWEGMGDWKVILSCQIDVMKWFQWTLTQLILQELEEVAKFNVLEVINKGLRELLRFKGYKLELILETIYYFNNCLDISLKGKSKSLILCLDQLQYYCRRQ